MEHKDIPDTNITTLPIEVSGQRKLSFTREDLDNTLNIDYQPQKLIELFKKNFQAEYDADAAVREGYSIEDHTLMVLNQFEKYFSQKTLPDNTDKNLFRVILALHDIGKPEAIKHGNKHLQHQYTMDILDEVLPQLEFNEDEIKLAKGLVSDDIIGGYLRVFITPQDALEKIKQTSSEINKTPLVFFDLLSILYQVDAGSYTLDSGGKKSLDHLFDFRPENHTMGFSSKINQQVKILKQNINN